MSVYSTHQNRQFYVATSVGEVNESSAAGTIEVGSVTNGVEKEVFFKYKGADSPMRSALIQVKNIAYIKAVSAEDLQDKLKKVTVKLSEDVNDGKLVSGQDYVLRIALRQFYGMSDEDQYFKYGCVHTTSKMTEEDFYKKMAESLTKNFSRELGSYLTFTGSADGLVIQEVEQPWSLGTYAQERVYFEAIPTAIYVDGDEQVWGSVEESTEGVVKDGKKIADMEFFYMGERADQYRYVGWPHIVPTKYLVDPSKEYNALEIHFAFTDTGASSYKSEKDITIVAEDASVINDLVSALNEATGLSAETLSGGGSDSTDSGATTDSTDGNSDEAAGEATD